MRKILFPVILILLILVPAGIYFSLRHGGTESSRLSQAISVVPEDAVWIIESGSVPELLNSITQSDPLFPAILEIANLKPYLESFRKIDSLVARNSRLKDFFAHSPAVISLHQTGKSQYQFLLILETQGSTGANITDELFTGLCGHAGQRTQRTYNGQQISRITFGVDALIPGISLVSNKNFLVISPSPILLENAVRQMKQDAATYINLSLNKLSAASGAAALAKVYVNLKILPTWLGGWMNNTEKRKLEMFSRYGDWASLDLSIRNDAVWLNGFALEGDTLNSYLNLFEKQQPVKLEAEQFLPSSTAVFFTLGVDKPGPYLKALSDYLGGSVAGRKRQRILNKADGLTSEKTIDTWINLGFKELTIGYLCGVSDETVSPFVLVSLKNGKEANDKIKSLPTKLPSGSMPFDGLPEILGGSFFSAVSGTYYSFIGDVMVLTDDIKTRDEIVNKYSFNKTLAHDAVYQSLSSMISTRSNVTFFAIPNKARPLLQGILNPKALGMLFSKDQVLLKTGAVGLQFNSTKGMSLHNLFFSFADIDYTTPQTIWESRLAAKVYTKPAIVTNHLTHEKEIIVQDSEGNLYLINASGRILWKKEVGELINSEIFQVDVLKNGRLQFLFSTGNAIHLLDRNGTYLPKFPLKLKSEATNGMALFDFDNNRDYRILIACSDNKIYGYDKNGRSLKGWSFGPASGPITQPVQYFKIREKDYLVCTDPVNVYVLDRKGAVKVNPGTNFAVSPKNRMSLLKDVDGKGPAFLITDLTGTVYSVFLNDTVKAMKCGDFGPDHYFNALDINQDGMAEYVYVDGNKLEIYRQSGERLLSRKLDGQVSVAPDFYALDGLTNFIGLTFPLKNEIVMYRSDGSLYKGFPLAGQTSFTLGNLDNATGYQNLLVGSDGVYLYNYAIK